MTSKHNRNKTRIKKNKVYQKDQTTLPPDHTSDHKDSKTSDTLQNLDWNKVIKKVTGDFDAASE